jgi:hypothetical protein
MLRSWGGRWGVFYLGLASELTFMQPIIDLYNQAKPWIEIVQTVIYFLGFAWIVRWLWSYRFERKCKEISDDLRMYAKITRKLEDHVREKFKNGISEIGIRMVWWKNYPFNLDNDAFKQVLFVNTEEVRKKGGEENWPLIMPFDNTCIKLSDYCPGFQGISVYLGIFGLWFFSYQGKKYKMFREVPGEYQVVYELPYKNIVNFDFNEFIEHEPVIYTKYKYNSWKIFSNRIFIDNQNSSAHLRKQEKWLHIDLDKRRFIYNRFLQKILLFIISKRSQQTQPK